MKIYAIQDRPATTTLDLDKFKSELQELSDRYDIKLVSIGAMSTVDSAGSVYLAVWSNEADSKQAD